MCEQSGLQRTGANCWLLLLHTTPTSRFKPSERWRTLEVCFLAVPCLRLVIAHLPRLTRAPHVPQARLGKHASRQCWLSGICIFIPALHIIVDCEEFFFTRKNGIEAECPCAAQNRGTKHRCLVRVVNSQNVAQWCSRAEACGVTGKPTMQARVSLIAPSRLQVHADALK